MHRYIERPLLILGRKFDIRQWVLVTSIDPLVAWRYSHYYLRFSSVEYTNDLSARDYRVAHLTNQSIQKKSGEYGEAIEGNMWDREQFEVGQREGWGLGLGWGEGAAMRSRGTCGAGAV